MYKRITVRKLTGQEKFENSGQKKFSVLEFWQYGFSSLNSNVLRGALAEFIVENALNNKDKIGVRSPWGDTDVISQNKKIEVKCCSYLQDWDQLKLTKIQWSGLKATELYYSEAVKKAKELDKEPKYKSDIYVLALVKHQDPSTLNLLDMNQWCFYVLSRDKIKEISGDKSAITLTKLEKNKIEPVGFADLSKMIIQR